MSLVIDNGCHTIKYGLSSDPSPMLLESVVGFERGNKPLEISSIVIGLDAIKKLRKDPKKIVSTRYPYQRGLIVDWTQMEALWRHCFAQVKTKEPVPVLMTMSPMGPQYQRESICELMFELFDVPQLYMEVPGYLSYLANFPSSEDGIVIESGAGLTNIVPIFKGQPDRKKIVNFGISGQDIASYLSKLIQLRGYTFEPKEEWKIVSHIKENIAYVSPDFDDELKICKKDPNEFKQELEVRTGEKIILDSECFRCPEIMFDPSLIGINQMGIHELVFNAINMYPDCQNVVLSGGNMKIPGMVERFERELKILSKQQGKKLKVKKSVLVDDFSAWKGGAKLAGEKINWATKDDYGEYGGNIIIKNCF